MTNLIALQLPNYPSSVSFVFRNATLGQVVTSALQYVYVMAGLALLVTLILGGFQLLTAAGSEDNIKAGYGKIKVGLIGFIIVFVTYFVLQIVQVVFGVTIL